jgi:hypothetical protein
MHRRLAGIGCLHVGWSPCSELLPGSAAFARFFKGSDATIVHDPDTRYPRRGHQGGSLSVHFAADQTERCQNSHEGWERPFVRERRPRLGPGRNPRTVWTAKARTIFGTDSVEPGRACSGKWRGTRQACPGGEAMQGGRFMLFPDQCRTSPLSASAYSLSSRKTLSQPFFHGVFLTSRCDSLPFYGSSPFTVFSHQILVGIKYQNEIGLLFRTSAMVGFIELVLHLL